MTPPATPERYKYHRFPTEIISHGAWLYYRFCLSYRDVEELLFVRGVLVSHEAIRKWCRKFGQAYANQLRHRRPRPGDKWHLEMCQTQPIKMPWCPLRLLRQMLSNLRGRFKRENEMDVHLFSRDHDFADQALRDGVWSKYSNVAFSKEFHPALALSQWCEQSTFLWALRGPYL